MSCLRPLAFALLALLSLSFAGAAAVAAEPPPVFDKRPYAEAKKAAEDGKKWFIVKATADWCAPCKKMDATTWRDEKVVAWLTANAVVVAVDVDKEAKLAGELSIEAMPTMVAFKEGKEFDRTVGYADAAAFLGWCEGMAKGEKSIEAVRKRAAQPADKNGKVDIQARMNLAQDMARGGKKAEAADEFVWLWENMLKHDPAYYGVRLSFLVGDMERLAASSPEAKVKFVALRDKAAKAIEGEKVDREAVIDWVALNQVVADSKATLAWYDKVKGERRWKPVIADVSRELSELFVKEKRYADLGALYADPLDQLRREIEFLKMMSRPPGGPDIDDETRKMMEEMPKERFRSGTSEVYAGLLAAGRDEVAGKYAALARETDPSVKMITALVTTALEADQPREDHRAWLKGAKDASLEPLEKRVDKALEQRKARQAAPATPAPATPAPPAAPSASPTEKK